MRRLPPLQGATAAVLSWCDPNPSGTRCLGPLIWARAFLAYWNIFTLLNGDPNDIDPWWSL